MDLSSHLASLIGVLGWVPVSHFSEARIELTYYGASWGATYERVELISFGEYTGTLGTRVGSIRMFEGLVRIIAMAFNFSYFFCVFTAIYLVLRRDVDKTDFDEVFVEDDQPRHSLPPLESSEEQLSAGVAATSEDERRDESGPLGQRRSDVAMKSCS